MEQLFSYSVSHFVSALAERNPPGITISLIYTSILYTAFYKKLSLANFFAMWFKVTNKVFVLFLNFWKVIVKT